MYLSMYKRYIILLFCVIAGSSAVAQYNSAMQRHPWTPRQNGFLRSWKSNNRFELSKPNIYQRGHIGYSMLTVAAEQKMTGYIATAPDVLVPEEITRTVRTISGHGLTLGSYFVLTRFKSDFAGLAFSFDFAYNRMAWEELDSGFTYRPRPDEIKPTDFSLQMGLPVSLDLKLGSDAMPSLNHKWSAAVGAGVYPMIAFTAREKKKIIKNSLNYTADYMPFVKLEGGLRAGVLMKVRLMLMFGGPTYLTQPSSIDGKGINAVNSYSLTGVASTNISFIVYPFSYRWPEYGWWN